MTINFTHKENIKGIYFLISQNAETEPAKLKALVQGLEITETKFRNLKINLPLSSLVKRIIVVNGKKEKNFISNLYKHYDGWHAFFVQQQDTIVFDLKMFNTSTKKTILGTLVHEIGHAIHLRFISDDAKNYISSIGKKYTDIIYKFEEVKSIINRVEEIKNDPDWFSQIISSYSAFLLEAFTKMKQNNITIEQIPEVEDFCDSLSKYAEILFFDFASLLDNSLDKSSLQGNNINKTSKISDQIRNEYITVNKPTYLSKVNAMISAIMKFIPSEYGASNEYEFFAECFRQFILSPDTLSLNNRNMVVNALTMSRAQGKELMQAHKLLKNYIEILIN